MRCHTCRCCMGEYMDQCAISSKVRKHPAHSPVLSFIAQIDMQGDKGVSWAGLCWTDDQRSRSTCQGVAGRFISSSLQG